MTPIQAKAKQVKASFADRGIPVRWGPPAHASRRSDVCRVFTGFTPCKPGLPPAIAVKLGRKPNPAKNAA